MEHHFNVEIAKKYGIQCAVILNNIYFWVEKNKANEKHYHNGRFWTYNSKKAFTKIMPYMTERQIDYAIQKLIDEGVLVTGNYNEVAYDRTLWYAITDFGYSILQNCEMEHTELSNGSNENVRPIPDNKPVIKTTDIKKQIDYQRIAAMYNDTCVSFPSLKALSDARKKSIKARLQTYTYDDFKLLFEKAEASDFLKGKNNRDWQASFDWLIKDANMAKVLDGNYDNKGTTKKSASTETQKQLETYMQQNAAANKIVDDANLYEGVF